MKISLVFTAHNGAGPVYSLEMAKALASIDDCQLQVIISNNVENIDAWNDAFLNTTVDFHAISSYKSTPLSVLISLLSSQKNAIVQQINAFKPDVLYVPFGLVWSRYVFRHIDRDIKIVNTIHDVEFHDSFWKLSTKEKGAYLLNFGTAKYIDGTVILNNKDLEFVKRTTKKPVAVIPHASFNYYFDDSRIIDMTVKNRIGFLGRIAPYKGLDLLVEAFEKADIHNLKLLIAGDGLIEPQLLSRIERNDRIELFNHYLQENEFQTLIDSVDFIVLPYKRASQSGIIPMSFAAGKAVIATNVGALSEQVPEGTGMIVPPTATDIAKAIKHLYNNAQLINLYARNAKKYADTELSWNHSAELLLGFCDTVIGKKALC